MRTTFTTPTPCIPPQIPVQCAALCQEKCHALGKCNTVIGFKNSICLPGCQCPNGTLWNGETCVIKEDCNCKDENGKIHEVNIFSNSLFPSILRVGCYTVR